LSSLAPRLYEFIFCPLGFIYGAVVGSFLNVAIYRLPHERSLLHPPSHCPWCRTGLSWYDLVPLLSQVTLKARCRYCGQRIAWRYFGVELFTAVSFALVVATSRDPLLTLQGLLLVAGLICTFFIDYDHFIIPDEVNWTLALGGLLPNLWLVFGSSTPGAGLSTVPLNPFGYASPTLVLPSALLGAAVAGGTLLLVREFGQLLFRKEAMGWGDVKLAAAVGANLMAIGTLWEVLTFYLLSFLIGAVISVGLMLLAVLRQGRSLPVREVLIGGLVSFTVMIALRALVAFATGVALGNEAAPANSASETVWFGALAAVVGVVIGLLAASRKLERPPEYIPFGPMLAVGAYATWFLGPNLVVPFARGLYTLR